MKHWWLCPSVTQCTYFAWLELVNSKSPHGRLKTLGLCTASAPCCCQWWNCSFLPWATCTTWQYWWLCRPCHQWAPKPQSQEIASCFKLFFWCKTWLSDSNLEWDFQVVSDNSDIFPSHETVDPSEQHVFLPVGALVAACQRNKMWIRKTWEPKYIWGNMNIQEICNTWKYTKCKKNSNKNNYLISHHPTYHQRDAHCFELLLDGLWNFVLQLIIDGCGSEQRHRPSACISDVVFITPNGVSFDSMLSI